MTKYNPISCQLYDRCELACIKGSKIKIEKVDKTTSIGYAQTIITKTEQGEFLQVCTQKETKLVRLDTIADIHLLT